MKIVWTDESIETLEDIYNFYVDKNNRVATNIFNHILTEPERLANFPNLGAIDSLLSAHPILYRSLVVQEHFRVFYFVDEQNETVVIVKIWDCRQNPERLQIH